ncbi:MAG: hypothetical protein PHX21_13160 [bacterium]|nr:hypothetical protein [bacterium]
MEIGTIVFYYCGIWWVFGIVTKHQEWDNQSVVKSFSSNFAMKGTKFLIPDLALEKHTTGLFDGL